MMYTVIWKSPNVRYQGVIADTADEAIAVIREMYGAVEILSVCEVVVVVE